MAGSLVAELRVPVLDGSALEMARELFAEYKALPHNVGRWNGSDELPGPYIPPRGGVLLALHGGRPVGCVLLAELEWPETCEMKRLYVRSDARGLGVGRAIVVALLEYARGLGYRVMRLDTAPELAAARSLYGSMGFREIPAYHTRYDDAICFEVDLAIESSG